MKTYLQISYFPNAWKIPKIHPIPKPGKNKSNLDSYRPISLLNTLGKVFEKIILTHLLKHLNTNNIIIPHQYGFREETTLVYFNFSESQSMPSSSVTKIDTHNWCC